MRRRNRVGTDKQAAEGAGGKDGCTGRMEYNAAGPAQAGAFGSSAMHGDLAQGLAWLGRRKKQQGRPL